jgi:uncharacterized protein (TIRG00374 family)
MLMPNPVLKKQYFISITIIGLTGLGLYGLLPQLAHFETTLTSLKQATPLIVLAGLAAVLTGYIFSALLYQLLSYKKLLFRNTLLVQLAGLLINRVLPGGIGGLGLNFLYLRAHRHTVTQATTVVALNNLIGFIGHVMILVVLISLRPDRLNNLSIPSITVGRTALALSVIAGFAIILGIIIVSKSGRRLRHTVRIQLTMMAQYYLRQPAKLVVALLVSCALTLSNGLALWLCCQAIGIDITFFATFLVFTFGVAAATATPTPGGLGGAEAALVGGLIAQHVALPQALAAALLYRLVTFWLGLLIGVIATAIMQSKRLLTH